MFSTKNGTSTSNVLDLAADACWQRSNLPWEHQQQSNMWHSCFLFCGGTRSGCFHLRWTVTFRLYVYLEKTNIIWWCMWCGVSKSYCAHINIGWSSYLCFYHAHHSTLCLLCCLSSSCLLSCMCLCFVLLLVTCYNLCMLYIPLCL